MISRAEPKSALERLRVAFRQCPADFDALKAEVAAGNVSLYEIQGDRYRVTIAGEIVGDSYFLWGVSGVGVVDAIKELAPVVRRLGLKSISAETYFPALARLVKRLNTQEQPSGKITGLVMRV